MKESEKIESLEKRTELLELKLDIILSKIDSISSDTSKMNKHVDFVEGVYNTLRLPLQTVARIVSGNKSKMPEIDNVKSGSFSIDDN